MPAIDLRKVPIAPGSRVAIFGPPNTLKTTAMLTWPKGKTSYGEGAMVIMLYPGEKGWDTIPRDREDIIPLVWQIEDPTKVSPAQIVREVEQTTWRALAGEYGKILTFCGDGLHKLYGWYYLQSWLEMTALFEKSQGDSAAEAARLPAYNRAHERFSLYVTKLINSSVPWLVCSMWEGRVKDNPDDPAKNAKRHVFPDLPGQMAKDIVGEFPSGVLYAEVTAPDPKGRVQGYWLTKKTGDIWGVGLKVPEEVALKIPPRIPAHFESLMRAIRGEVG